MDRRVKHMRGLLLCGMLLAAMWVGVSVTAAVEIGDQAPDFNLPSTLGEKVSLSQFRGKKHVLVQFYSRDFNPT